MAESVESLEGTSWSICCPLAPSFAAAEAANPVITLVLAALPILAICEGAVAAALDALARAP